MTSSPAIWEWVLSIGVLLVILALALHAGGLLAEDVVNVALKWPIQRPGP